MKIFGLKITRYMVHLFAHILFVKNYVISMAHKIAYHIARNIGSDDIW